MPLKAYEEFAQEPLAFPIGGKTYTVPPLGFTDGILLQRIIAGEESELENAPVEEGWKLILGSVFEDMVADRVPMEAVARAGLAAMADFQYGREAAEKVWESRIDPKALADAIATAQSSAAPASQPSSSTAGARKTRSRASTTGTTSPKTTPRTRAKGAKRSAS